MEEDTEAIIEALRRGILNAWDWAVIEDAGHEAASHSMAEGALMCLEARGFKVVRKEDA